MRKILLVLLLCNQLATAQNLNNLSFGTDSTFEVVSWNIEWFPKNGQTTANYVETILTNLEADIYALQEIDDTTLLKQVVANIPGYECYFKSTYYGGLGYVYNTNTVQINNKYEIYTSQPFWNAFPRSPQVLDLTHNGKQYYVINNHLKCCGDGSLDMNNSSDEEMRRYMAVYYLKQYIDNNLANKNVIVVGDLNDELTDFASHNVFQDFITDPSNYLFADMQIANSSNTNWSYPSWPSHLDHILITNELFDEFQNQNSYISTIKVDDYLSSWNQYDNNISDHRPIGIRLVNGSISSISETQHNKNKLIKITDLLGRESKKRKKQILFYLYDNGTVEKRIVVE
ncbi:MAG: endonuclease/exonuclease/phosphatase family protein [Flavobacteriales bacterium]|nr:endonuclease/exonuclease/phosphatase family protein [Flavobacteriales bacterium]